MPAQPDILSDHIAKNRSCSSSPLGSDTSSYWRSAEDLLDRLRGLKPETTVHLWSAGNVRVNGHDLTMTMPGTVELLAAMRQDKQFEFMSLVYLDETGDDWKASYRLSPPVSPASASP